MAIEFHCSNQDCRKKLKVGDERAGKKARCPKCKTVSVVPRVEIGADDSTGYEATLADSTERGTEPTDEGSNERDEGGSWNGSTIVRTSIRSA